MQTEFDIVTVLEILCIAAILLIQFYQYSLNRRKIDKLEALYPDEGLEIVEIPEVVELK